jgi:hypothetical protein
LIFAWYWHSHQKHSKVALFVVLFFQTLFLTFTTPFVSLKFWLCYFDNIPYYVKALIHIVSCQDYLY